MSRSGRLLGAVVGIALAGPMGAARAADSEVAARIVFFTPSDVVEPPGVTERLTRVAEAAERFFLEGMKRHGYPSAAERLFARARDGSVEILRVRGSTPGSDAKYQNPLVHTEAIQLARQAAGIQRTGDVWWIFTYLGPPPVRYQDWKGAGDSADGGWALVNYDSSPGAIRPEASLAAGFNAAFALKGAIHELGHGFGLPHVGPDGALGLGNSLMGPNNEVYRDRKFPRADQVYLTESSAALLWKHPLFSGTTADRSRHPEAIQLTAFKPTYSRTANRITLTGQVAATPLPHSVIIRDDLGRPRDGYWHLGHAARVAPDGTFRLTIDRPNKVDGHYEIEFAFPNGMTTGDGPHIGNNDRGPITKSYRFRNGVFQFGD